MAIPISPLITAIPVEQDVKRKPNFTDQEKSFLIYKYEIYKPILASKLCDQSTNRQKHEIWKSIARELNSLNPQVERTTKDVKKKWENLATQSRKEFLDFRQNQNQSLPYVAPVSSQTLKVLELIDDITLQNNNQDQDQITISNDDQDRSSPIIDRSIKQEVVDNQNLITPNGDYESAGLIDNRKSEITMRSIIESAFEFQSTTSSSSSDSTNGAFSGQFLANRLGDQSINHAANASNRYGDQSINQSNRYGEQSITQPIDQSASSYISKNLKRTFDSSIDTSAQEGPSQSLNNEDDDCSINRDMKKLKRMKMQLETEKLILEKKKLELEIQYLNYRMEKDKRD